MTQAGSTEPKPELTVSSSRGTASAGAGHLVALDGLRGIAAIWVVFHHLGLLSSRGYLAVDFFFCLSGYIVGLAYEERLRHGLPFLTYARIRLVRLYPMLFLGNVLGLIVLYWTGTLTDPGVREQGSVLFAIVVQFALLHHANPVAALVLNSPQWTIVFEIAANLLHAWLLRWLTLAVLVLVIAISAGVLIWLGHDADDLSVGQNRATAVQGIARVTFGFPMGLVLFRTRERWMPLLPCLPFWLIALVLILSFSTPTLPIPGLRTGGRAAASIILLYPALVALGVKCRTDARGAVLLGLLSYPLYALHFPFVTALQHVNAVFLAGEPAYLWVLVRLGGSAVILAVGLAAGLWIEKPVNAWRKRKFVDG